MHFSPITVGVINTRQGKPKIANLRILFDLGASFTIITGKYAQKLRIKTTKPQNWRTQAGNFQTNKRAKIELILPELDMTKIVT